MAELVKGFGVYGAGASSSGNEKNSLKIYGGANFKGAVSAGEYTYPSIINAGSLNSSSTTGLSFTQAKYFTTFWQSGAGEEQTIESVDLFIAQGGASASAAFELFLANVSFVSKTAVNYTLGSSYSIPSVPNGMVGFSTTITTDFTGARDRAYTPIIKVPIALPAFRYVLTINLKSSLT